MSDEVCPGCGERFAPSSAGTHRYLGASSGCWAVFGEVLARDYQDPAYFRGHGLCVDAYAAQHPGVPGPQSTQSVAVHLVALQLQLEENVVGQPVIDARRAVASWKNLPWLPPPSGRYDATVRQVHAARDAAEHCAQVEAWGRAVWRFWAPHHPQVRAWAQKARAAR